MRVLHAIQLTVAAHTGCVATAYSRACVCTPQQLGLAAVQGKTRWPVARAPFLNMNGMCTQQQQAWVDESRMVGQITTGAPKVEDGAAGCTWYGRHVATIFCRAGVYLNTM